MTRVLVVDDDARLLRTLHITLTARGYEVLTAADGATALRIAARHHPDVVVLDLGLPDLDGTAVVAALRERSTVPVVVLSARSDAADKVRALDRGADDYVTKPFGVEELRARLRAAVRRATTAADGRPDLPLHAGDLTIDLADKIVHRDGQQVRLTPTEWSILELLARNPASWSAAAGSSTTSGARRTARRPATCACTSPSSARSSSGTPRTPATSSPRPAWATTGSAPERRVLLG